MTTIQVKWRLHPQVLNDAVISTNDYIESNRALALQRAEQTKLLIKNNEICYFRKARTLKIPRSSVMRNWHVSCRSRTPRARKGIRCIEGRWRAMEGEQHKRTTGSGVWQRSASNVFGRSGRGMTLSLRESLWYTRIPQWFSAGASWWRSVVPGRSMNNRPAALLSLLEHQRKTNATVSLSWVCRPAM